MRIFENSPITNIIITNKSEWKNGNAYCAFNNSKYLTDASSIDFDNNISVIRNLFRDCQNLVTPPKYLPASATDADNCFANCYKLEKQPILSSSINYTQNLFANCYSLKDSPQCPDGVWEATNMYFNCYNLTGNPVVGEGITALYHLNHMYYNCSNLTGNAEFGQCSDLASAMGRVYYNCVNLTGANISNRVINMYGFASDKTYYNFTPACGDNVIDMHDAYIHVQNLNGPPVCGNNVINMSYSYYNSGVSGKAVVGPNVQNMSLAYHECDNLSESPDYIPNTVTNCFEAFYQCYNMTGNATLPTEPLDYENLPKGKNLTAIFNYMYAYCYNLNGYAQLPNVPVTDTTEWHVYSSFKGGEFFDSTFYHCNNLIGINIPDSWENISHLCDSIDWYRGEPACGNNVTDMSYAYHGCRNLTGNAVCGPYVTNMVRAYDYCYNLNGTPACGNNVTTMANTYSNCWSLTGEAVCGPNVIYMFYTYQNCYNLTGSAACGDSVISMYYAYYNCNNIIYAACGNNVINMWFAYANCTNLITAVCGNNVVNMTCAYDHCTNLTTPAIGPNVIYMNGAFQGCTSILEDTNYFIGNKAFDMSYAFSLVPVGNWCVIDSNNVNSTAYMFGIYGNIKNVYFSSNQYCFSKTGITFANAGQYKVRDITTNVIFNNYDAFIAVANDYNFFGCDMSGPFECKTPVIFNLNNNDITAVRYSYNSLINIYIYCTE